MDPKITGDIHFSICFIFFARITCLLIDACDIQILVTSVTLAPGLVKFHTLVCILVALPQRDITQTAVVDWLALQPRTREALGSNLSPETVTG